MSSWMFLDHWYQFHRLEFPDILHMTDSQAVIKRIQYHPSYKPLNHDADIFSYIRLTRAKLDSVKLEHVKSHQIVVTWLQWLNTLCDCMATHLLSAPKSISAGQFIGAHVTLMCNEVAISTDIQKTICLIMQKTHLADYI